ncbi:uncharacterized [Tachysurus ichikawai]
MLVPRRRQTRDRAAVRLGRYHRVESSLKRSKWTARRNGASPERIRRRYTESEGDAYGNVRFLIYKVVRTAVEL